MIAVKVTVLTGLAILALCSVAGGAEPTRVKVSSRPMHAGRISPMLFGGFIELLDDLVPGMWAEMLNDRGFEGVTKRADWCYYDGAPNVCDREWERNDSWSHDAESPFNGSKCARLVAREGREASLSQTGLAAKKGQSYVFSGYLRADRSEVSAEILLKSMLPDGKWMALCSARLPKLSREWKRYTARMVSDGTTEGAVFELKAAGTGILRADKLSLMPADNVKGWRKEVVQAIKEARPGIVRWGGSVCDPGGYRWKNGVGDRDLRVPFPNKVWGRIDSNDVGIDEFCQFCELVRVEPLICLSFSDGPQSAADLVHYCKDDKGTEWGAKRAANGHASPYAVKYWQLGNELSDAAYVNALPEFCTAMKAADPNAILMSSMPSQALLDKVGKDIRYICPHHYTPDLGACDADFGHLAEMIGKTPGCGHIRIAVTEWNSTAGDFGLMRGRLLTLQGALHNARYLNLLMRRSDIADIACRSNMTNSLCSGMIGTNPSRLLKRPSYYVMKLYADHAKGIPMSVEGVPVGLDIISCASEDKKSVCIFAVNPGAEPVDLHLDLSEFGPSFRPIGGEVVRDTQDARQPDVMNHWDAPDRVRTVKLSASGDDVVLPGLSASAIECASP